MKNGRRPQAPAAFVSPRLLRQRRTTFAGKSGDDTQECPGKRDGAGRQRDTERTELHDFLQRTRAAPGLARALRRMLESEGANVKYF